MKTLLTPVVVSLVALTFTPAVQAAPPSQSASHFAKKFGPFSPGDKFTLKVTEVLSQSATLDGTTGDAPIPKGIPKLKKGRKVTFTIGKKGQLTGPGFKINHSANSTTAISFVNKPTAAKPDSQVGTVYLNFKNKPQAADLTFIKIVQAGFNTKTHTVSYVLE